MMCEFVTMPNYMVLFYFDLSVLVYCCGYGGILDLIGQNIILWYPVVLVGSVMWMMVGWTLPTGKLAATLNLKANAVVKSS